MAVVWKASLWLLLILPLCSSSFALSFICLTFFLVRPLTPTCFFTIFPSSPLGGFISFNGSWRVQGILAMSRSLGDYPLKNLNVVIPDPDVMSFDLDKLQPEFMILASDGLWDTFSNEEAVRFIRERLDEPHFGAKSIVLQSYYRGCPDNITVMVVKFKGKDSER